MRGNGGEEWRGELLEFGGADPVDRGEFVLVARSARGHVEKCAVRKDEIGRQPPFLRQFEAQRLQGCKQRIVAVRGCRVADGGVSVDTSVVHELPVVRSRGAAAVRVVFAACAVDGSATPAGWCEAGGI